MRSKNIELERNQLVTTAVDFLESYNKGIPIGYPHASFEILKQFEAMYPSLFKQRNEWSIDKHRKKLMDWLSSRRVALAA